MRITLTSASDATCAYSIYGGAAGFPAGKPIIIRNCWSLKVQIRWQDPDLSRSNRSGKVGGFMSQISLFFLRASRLALSAACNPPGRVSGKKACQQRLSWWDSSPISRFLVRPWREESMKSFVHMKITVRAVAAVLHNARAIEKSRTVPECQMLPCSDQIDCD